jgi:hypothetical protein
VGEGGGVAAPQRGLKAADFAEKDEIGMTGFVDSQEVNDLSSGFFITTNLDS